MQAVATAATSTPSDEFFLARQPILGRDQKLVAFELLFRAAPEHDAVPDRIALVGVEDGAHRRVDSVCPDKQIAGSTNRFSIAFLGVHGNRPATLFEVEDAAAGADDPRSQTLDHSLMDDT